jgi:hypothetical protein
VWAAVVFRAFGIVLCMFPVAGPHPTASSMTYTVVINMAGWPAALAYYYIDARKWFTGPNVRSVLRRIISTPDADQRDRSRLISTS